MSGKEEVPNEGVGDSDTRNDNEKKSQEAANEVAPMTTTNEEPPSKKQRLEETEPPETAGDNNTNNTNNRQTETIPQTEKQKQHEEWQQKQQQKQQRQGKKTSKKKLKTKHMDPKILKVRKIIQEGCRTNDLASAMNAYEEALKEGIRIEAQSYYNLLNLCDGLDRDERKVHVGTPKHPKQEQPQAKAQNNEPKDVGESSQNANAGNKVPSNEAAAPTTNPPTIIDSKKRQEYVFAIKQRMQSKEVNLPLNETAYSAIVKILSKNKEFAKAEEILNEAETVQQCKPKLRLYASLLSAYCEDHQLTRALECWKRLRLRSVALKAAKSTTNDGATAAAAASAFCPDGMDVTEREYLSLLRCAVRTADTAAVFYNDGSDLVMEDVLTRLAEDVPVPAKDTVSAIADWFDLQNKLANANGNGNGNGNDPSTTGDRKRVQELLETIRSHDSVSEPSPRMGPVVTTDSTPWTISQACSIDGKTGVLLDGCLEGHKLHPVPLSDRSFRDMTTMNESIVQIGNIEGNAHAKFQGGRKGKKRKDFSPEDRKIEWKRFNSFLEEQVAKKRPDGTEEPEPYDVVIDGANIGYFKQNFAFAPRHVDYEQIDWVVKHFTHKLGKKVLLIMHNRHFSRHMLPRNYQGLCDSWIREGILYKTPPGMNDDWFWMHAALKYKTLVVTNDEMRDHHFQMLAPKFFLRWKERHQIHFDIGAVEEKSTNRGVSGRLPRQVLLTYPEVYSRRIQRVADGLVVPLTKRGDENRFLDGCHVASEDEPDTELYLCVRPSGAAPSSDPQMKGE